MNRPPVVEVERVLHHLRDAKRLALDADDVAQCAAIKESIRTLEEIARSLRAEQYLAGRKRRAEVQSLRERNERNRILQMKLAAVEGKFPTALPKAA